jgi:hypothetical protein
MKINHLATLLVTLFSLSMCLCADLRVGQSQLGGDFVPVSRRQVLLVKKSLFQLEDLKTMMQNRQPRT